MSPPTLASQPQYLAPHKLKGPCTSAIREVPQQGVQAGEGGEGGMPAPITPPLSSPLPSLIPPPAPQSDPSLNHPEAGWMLVPYGQQLAA